MKRKCGEGEIRIGQLGKNVVVRTLFHVLKRRMAQKESKVKQFMTNSCGERRVGILAA